MRSVLLGLAALTVAVLAACASSNASGPAAPINPGAGSGVASSTTSGGPTAAHNKAAAQAQADRLVSMVTLPPGAVRVAVQSGGLTGPAMGTPGTTQLIDSVTYYRISMSLAQARSWFQAKPQHGFIQSGTASSSGPAGPTGYGFQYDPTSPPLPWGSASLEISLAPHGPVAAAIRVDGVAQWINPTPTRDSSRGPAIRVTISGGCPRTDRGWRDVSNPDTPDLDLQLLPGEAPTAAYNGLKSKPLNAAQASSVAAQIRALPLGSRGLLPHSCPLDDASASILVFSYPGRAEVDIWHHTSGSSSTYNGHIISGHLNVEGARRS